MPGQTGLNKFSKRRNREKGTTVVELSLVVIAFLVMIVGLLDVGRGVWAYNTLSAAATAGARHAIVNGDRSSSPATADSIRTFVRGRLPGLSGVNVTSVWDPDNAQGSAVRVTVEYPFQPVVRIFQPVTLRATSRMVISY